MSLERSDLAAFISRSALVHNSRVLRRFAAPRQLFVVVKADAYGHGLLPIALACAAHVDGFCVFSVAEACELRAADALAGKPILLMGGTSSPPDLLELARIGSVWPAITTPEQLAAMLAAKGSFERIFLKAQTGMNRLGLPAAKLGAAYAALRQQKKAASFGLMNHYACADLEGGCLAQAESLAQIRQELQLPFTTSNSAASMIDPPLLPGEEFVRCGIGLYGCSAMPKRKSAAALGLKAVLGLRAKVLAVQSLKAGAAVGYGAEWQAAKDTRIAVVSCGYADGYPLRMPAGAPVLINQRRCSVVGRVSMDMLSVEVGDSPCAVGDEALLWGPGLSADEVAAHSNTLAYELLTSLNARVPRHYVD